LLVVANWFETRLYDISDRHAPRFIAQEDADDSSMAVSLNGDLLGVGDWNNLSVYRIDATAHSAELHMTKEVQLVGEGEVTATLTVDNRGDLDLSVTNTFCGENITAEPSAFTLAPGFSQSVVVSATVAVGASWEDTCRLVSNDIDEPESSVALTINPTGLSVGDPAPDWTLPTLTGDYQTLSDYRGQIVLISIFSSL